MNFQEFSELYPTVTAGLRGLTVAIKEAGLDPALTELVKIRASQINGCAFCLRFHLTAARGLGIDKAKLDLLAAWRDSGVFTTREQAALAWTERLTALPQTHLSEAEREEARCALSPEIFAQLCVAIATINAWNRIAAGLGFPPPG
ncbi:MAG: carboxymuconolactone decarboxylase family protein [Rhodospirillales bacterium]|nr:carboxymuconolactone decarboxylase family protein [Rhodospirillales bacterium]MDE2318757.1 carboxymuconolactone decarboxylase family protein [Rhodospirillales bacterium]